MLVINTIKEIVDIVNTKRAQNLSIGLVPTMGALHEGHTSLVEHCIKENDITIVSIFVNPTQFNDKNDLNNYPRTLEADTQLLERKGVDYVFAPTVNEIYPEPDTRIFSYPPIDTVMEGAKRPGHFNGVCQIVSKLFDITKPHRAYFGEKDFQQIAVVTAMTEDLKIPVKLCTCPIVREDNGLALSSRNTLLSAKEKAIAPTIYKVLQESLPMSQKSSVEDTINFVVTSINKVEGLDVEYFQIVDGKSLQPIKDWSDSHYIVGCITVYCGSRPVRLIDNITYKKD